MAKTNDDATARERIGQVFRYLQELHRVKTPPVVQLRQRDWVQRLAALPRTPNVQTGFQIDADGRLLPDDDPGAVGFVLKVERPAEIECPEPSVMLKNWLKPEYRDARVEPADVLKDKLKVRGKQQAFTASDERVEAFEKWSQERAEWATTALQIAETFEVFSELFALYARFERESEKYQLFLADGMLEMDHEDGPVRHPLLLQRVELRFDPAVPQFTIVDSADMPEVYTPLLRYLGVDGRTIQHATDAVAAEHFHPLAGAGTSAFLRDLAQRLSINGQFFEDTVAAAAAPDGPRIVRDPHLFLGNRSYGLADNIERYLRALEQGTELPASLLRIVGVERERNNNGEGPRPVLLTKPANQEQIEVIQRLEETGAVLVQGPPGTGKSHTIANLIGHLLAQNKSILVTSHASKALRVVREKLAPALQPLCVSVLQSDEESARQLQESITGIVNTLASTSEKKLDKELARLDEQRQQLLAEQDQLRQALLTAVKAEHQVLSLGGKTLTPADVARQLGQWHGKHDWIPGPVVAGTELPLTVDELKELYEATSALPAEQERMARSELPDASVFATPKQFASLLDELAQLEKLRAPADAALWLHDKQDPAQFGPLQQRLQDAVAMLQDKTAWLADCLDAGRTGGPRRAAWLDLAQQIEDCAQGIPLRETVVLELLPEIVTSEGHKQLATSCREIAEHLEAGYALNAFPQWGQPGWTELLHGVTVQGAPPERSEDFRAVQYELEIRELRAGLRRRWDLQMAPLGAPEAEALGQRPEHKALPYAMRMRQALDWLDTVWADCLRDVERLGLDWARLEKTRPARGNETEIDVLVALVERQLPGLLVVRTQQLRAIALRAERDAWLQVLDTVPRQKPLQALLQRLRTAIKKGDYDAYADAWQELARLHEHKQELGRIDELLGRLEAAAPAWAKALRERQAPHDGGRVPGDAAMAWHYRQGEALLAGRAEVDTDKLQEQFDAATEALFDCTASYVEKRSWLAQLHRTGLEQQQALAGWLQLHKKIGKGTGKNTSRLKEDAGRALTRCRSAVPVWIMPLSRVLEFFDLATTRFDVVILDEASQCDVMGLLALALGREVLVVGDHEQVSPYAVGIAAERVQSLIDELLPDVPNRQLYDARTSVYDLAQQSFGGTIRLLEHFRCVPDIIRFSNDLCYSGEIRALREASSTAIKPALVAHRVKGGVEENGINELEAQEIAALVAAVCRLEEYEHASIGVISMVGTEQAVYIDSILRTRLSTTEYRRRQILCGNASQFQGDERDVIFISMVNSPGEHALAMRQRDDVRKVVNVAASRARDQLWVVHSLDPRKDLKAGDLRLQLISHAEGGQHKPKKAAERTERWHSEFEKDLCHKLTAQGFRVLRNFPVGDVTIELVVEGQDSRRIALQLDGDRARSDEEVEQQLTWQSGLRRLGWEFVRVRASEALRSADAVHQHLLERLAERGVKPLPPKSKADAKAAAAAAEIEPLQVRVVRRAEMMRSRWTLPSSAELLAVGKRGSEPEEPDEPDEPKGPRDPEART